MVLPFLIDRLLRKIERSSNADDSSMVHISFSGMNGDIKYKKGSIGVSNTHVPTVNPPRPPLRNKPTSRLDEIDVRKLEMLGWNGILGHDGYTCTPMFLYYDITNRGNEVCRHGVILRRATDAYGTVLYR